ncbi:MAG: type II secretion system protein [Desulfobulbaceae bacterium]|nr:type II secretion system protein [Desulfobulbaceae bacterium]
MKQGNHPDRGNILLNSRHGFTLVEVICVLLLISIVTTVVLSRTMDHSVELIAEMEVVKGHLRYAQSRAMNSNQGWGINFSGNSYTLEEDGAASVTALPGLNGAINTLAEGTISSSANPIIFNQWGNPGATPITVTISDGTESQSFTISPLTGFIP